MLGKVAWGTLGVGCGLTCKATTSLRGGGTFFQGNSTVESEEGSSNNDGIAQCFIGVGDPITIKPKTKKDAFSMRFRDYRLAEVIPVSHDVALFRFLLQDPNDVFNLKPCSTLQAQFKAGATAMEQFTRFYTPVTPNGTKGYFDLIVKRKPKGKMTEHMFGMQVGETLSFRMVAFKIQYKPNRWDWVGMIAGGTGFTPMLQVIRHALTDPFEPGVVDHTKLSFLYCNRTEKHVLLKGLFDKLAKDYSDRFRVYYCVDSALNPAEWKGYTGYVTPQMIRETMPPPTPRNYIMVCGPDHLLQHVCGTSLMVTQAMSAGKPNQPVALDANNLTLLGGVLKECGYDDNQVFRF